MMSILAAALLLTTARAALAPVRQWADFSSALGHNRTCTRRGGMVCGLSDDEAAYVASTYDVVSIEKCFGTGPGAEDRTMANFVATAAQLKASNERTKVLFYWNARVAGPPRCYEAAFGAELLAHPDWWLRRDDGKALCVGPGERTPVCDDDDMTWPYVDFSVRAAADWWVAAPLAARDEAGANMSGVFFDSCDHWDWTLWSNVSESKAAAWAEGQRAALKRARDGLKARDADAFVVGNGFGAKNDTYLVDLVLGDVLDGLCAEHLGAFEWVEDRHTGAVNASVAASVPWPRRFSRDFETSFPTSVVGRGALARRDGNCPEAPLLVKTWVGPEITPIDADGPRYFSYGWWYDVSQGPLWRVDQLDVAVGDPLGPPEFAGLACRRDYEGATVSVDLARWDSAAIVPKGT
ncbi:glycosyl hydrolase [Aureococcus anophagefferens]|nr:glycosyl hydrolase [Aureococcus anophagefferens]